MKKAILLAALAALTLVPLSCYSPKHLGSGEISTVNLPLALSLDITRVEVSPGEEHVLCEASGDKQWKLMLNRDLSVPRMKQIDTKTWTCGAGANDFACLTALEFKQLTLPGWKPAGQAKKPIPGASIEARLHALPEGGGYVVTSNDRAGSNVWIVAGTPPVFGRNARSALAGSIQGRGVDRKTGTLVLTDGHNQVELFDLAAMKSVEVLVLPCTSMSGAVAVKGGFAYIGTNDGRMVPIDIENRAVGSPRGLGGPGKVFLSFSNSGGFLLAAVQDTTESAPYPTNLTVLVPGAEPGRPERLIGTYTHLRNVLRDVAILDTTEIAVLACGSDLLEWKFKGRP